ncbi:2860_t:CDS:2, partial [Acaulospora colombiana]
KKLKCDKDSNGIACSQCFTKNFECKTRTKKKPGPKSKNKNNDDNSNYSPDDLDIRVSSDRNSDSDFTDDGARLNVSALYSLSPISPNYSSSPAVSSLTNPRDQNSDFPFHAIELINTMSIREVDNLETNDILSLFNEHALSPTMSSDNSEDDDGSGLGINFGKI